MKLGILKFIFILIIFFTPNFTLADLIEARSAKIKILDKITSEVLDVEIEIDKSYIYGNLKILIYACYKSPPEDIPENYVLLRVFDNIKKDSQKVFQGWMISSSPSSAPFEHPIYDIWLKECKIN